MNNTKKVQEQELKKLEDEAYFELCQIIAEAMQYQDIELLNARIAYWKNKYKKLLDGAASPNFKKRIEFLLNQYYSSVTQYILSQLKFKEEQKVKNQAKAMKELYLIIKSTKDLPLLKKKIAKWKDKYPVAGFLDMYQKRIRSYTREKNLEENAFAQEEAFSDLVDITKKYVTIDELNEYIKNWEEKYSINNNFKIDDFIKHQSEIKRFTSPDFLQSIAREEPEIDNKGNLNKEKLTEEYNNRPFSDLSVQAAAYSKLLSISKSPNSIDEMFRWVYKNNHIKFNDKYKEMILRETYLYYSPTYLRKLNVPNIDMSKSSLSFDEYKNINDIKRYAIISYFNLLLPPSKAIANDYFTKHIQVIYYKSERARTTSKIEEPTLSTDEFLSSGLEIPLDIKTLENNKDFTGKFPNKEPENKIDNPEVESKSIVDLTKIEEVLSTDSDNQEKFLENDLINSQETYEDIENPQMDVNERKEKNLSVNTVSDKGKSSEIAAFVQNNNQEPLKEENSKLIFPTVEEQSDSNNSYDIDSSFNFNLAEDNSNNTDTHISKSDDEEKDLDYNQVVVLSPLFFAAVNNLDKQAKVVEHIDHDATNYIESQKAQENSLYESVKIKTDE